MSRGAIRLVRPFQDAFGQAHRTVVRETRGVSTPPIEPLVFPGHANVGHGHKPFQSGCTVMPVDRPPLSETVRYWPYPR
jgi:hypothetical protein